MLTQDVISVRELVEFLLRSGDLDNRTGGTSRDMQEGSRLHRKIQDTAGETYASEVPLSCLYTFNKKDEETEAGTVLVEGRADGIYEGTIPEAPGEKLFIIDEIKTTARHLNRIREPEPVHLAQAKCYAYMYALQADLPDMGVRMTYCSRITERVKYFTFRFTKEELVRWFDGLMEEYRKWSDMMAAWGEERTASLKALVFPFPYREGQRDLAAAVYRTIARGRKLFLEAPTGTGKTLTTLFPAAKAVGEGLADRIFYLTAKTVTGTAAEDALELFRQQGTRLKTCTLTAREKICILEKPSCNPEDCPRAAGHFDRVNEAMMDLFRHEDRFDAGTIGAYAKKHNVCPFELGLDMSLLADVVICDYNYLFDPHAGLKRFFGDGAKAGRHLFLIDEAHNLVDRGREMYSAALVRSEVLTFKKKVKGLWPELDKNLNRLAKELLSLYKEIGDEAYVTRPDFAGILQVTGETEEIMTGILGEERDIDRAGQHEDPETKAKKKEVRQDFLDFFFAVSHFNLIGSLLDEHYVCYAEPAGKNDVAVHLFNVDPSVNLKACMDKGVASILFSATFLPIQYYKRLLGGTKDDYEIYAHSVFDPEKRGLFLVRDVTSRYSERGEKQYEKIADCILKVCGERNGNYMVFFPSYAFLKAVEEKLEAKLGSSGTDGEPGEGGTQILCQSPGMREEERRAFLDRFGQYRNDRSLIGLCILGGIFGEGIDLKSDALIGAIVVGTGIPMVCTKRKILRTYFDENGGSGWDYAYRFPGMNKVLQAAGRVIRTREDVGIVALLDDRFLAPDNRRLFPAEWENIEETDTAHVASRIERFWNEWL